MDPPFGDAAALPPRMAGDPQADFEPAIQMEGVVERIVYESPDTGFLVARLRVKEQPDLVTFVGDLMAISPGETIRLRGRWVDDRKFGRQLRVESYQTVLPTSLEGIERYLGSGLIPGIGPAYAKRVVEAFGLETLRVIEEQPERLRAVPGIGTKRIRQIREGWSSQKAVQSILIFLQGHGVSTAQAIRIYKQYGDAALAILRENPYRLAQDISGIAFRGADAIARELGIEKDSPVRVEAGIVHALHEALDDGHVFLPQGALGDRASELLGVSKEAISDALIRLSANGALSREGEAVYLPQWHLAERGCADAMKRLLRTPCDPRPIQVEKAIAWAEKTLGIQLAPEQCDAIRHGVENKALIITGGPGTGKTTVINSLLAILEKKAVSFLLAAPTGRAAKRMEAATGRDARTLHRLLEFSPQHGAFQRHEHNPLVADLIVVDEASMIDVQLMDALLKAIPPFARLILVGDVDQLPSVGAGNVLFDLIASAVVPVVRLNTVYRQAAGSGIIAAAHEINTGRFPAFNDEDFFLIKRHRPEHAVETIVELITHRMPARFGLDPLRDIQVLSPMRKGEAGVNRLNEVLQQTLNPRGEPLPRRNLRKGDKVMQLRNNYELDVFNGDAGIITTVDLEANELQVTFDDGRVVLYSFDDLDDLGLAYAATVHKSQGSEYPAVILVFLTQHYMMLQRNVLYTAITRGKRLVVLVGDPKAVGAAVRNNQITRRNSHLTERLRNEI